MIKLIATDMDGTLLDEKGEINPGFYEVYEELLKKDIIFAAASGRQYFNLEKKFEKIKDNMLFIAENGTFVVYKGKELLVNSLDKDLALKLIDIARKIDNSYVILCGKKSAYIENSDERLIKETKKYYERYEIVEDITEIEDEILKVTICDFSGSEENSYKYFKDFYKLGQVTVSGEIWLDITANNVNKGVSMGKIQKALNIGYDETMVFGDYLNDLELMKSGYYSYAMENAHEDLKKVSRFIAKSNTENGVVEAIKEVVLKTINA
ncbi:HAD family hydrolase [Clostridium sp.]|uniref:HAD family hydrolase n=1 Tax=Clostridium sp. TaxID=1506 RepID=UPI002637CB1B|nr:HAD family hydrolase [Clostridium sp.]